ncbi:MAG: CRISPR-associated helicase Cas3' [Lachnospiraceae bacterium]
MYFINLNDVIKTVSPIYAHRKEDESREFLDEHIERCKYYFQKLFDDKNLNEVIYRFCSKMGFENNNSAQEFAAYLLAQVVVFHDFGKINPVFQREKMKNNSCQGSYKGVLGSEHSFLSAIIYLDYFWNEIEVRTDFEKEEKKSWKRLVLENSFVIARHHSNMESFSAYAAKLQSEETNRLLEQLQEELPGYRGLRCLSEQGLSKFVRKYQKMKSQTTRIQDITSYFFNRLTYSVLVACDYYATTDFIHGIQKRSFGTMTGMREFKIAYSKSKIMQSIRNYEKERDIRGKLNIHDINDLRSELFLEVEKNFRESPCENIYFVEAPTGGGKSNIALNLSFHMMGTGKKLFYIYPFNTLVEQNLQSLYEIFPEEELRCQIAVVNSLTPIRGMENKEEGTKEYYELALLDRQFLNYPFILSTHVSFFGMLFGSRKDDLFGFLQLSGAVVVLDEIQSYRCAIWAEIIIFLKACAELFGMKVIVMSATLPDLKVLGGSECETMSLLPNSSIFFSHVLFRDRVKVSYELLGAKLSLEELKCHIKSKCNGKKKILIEFIKKKTANIFYQMLCESEDISAPVLCMTGDDSLYERRKILDSIRKNSAEGTLLIATTVIEAGVDIDMDIGYKDISKTDSEEQFMGRINRSCRREGEVYFFDMDNASSIYRDDYRVEETLTLKSEQMREVLRDKTFDFYYKKVFEILLQNRNLNTGRDGLDYFFREHVKILDYPAIEERMKLIEDENWSMSIVLCRTLQTEDGASLEGRLVWEDYKILLQDQEMEYAKKQVLLSEVRSKLNYFTYQIKKNVNLAVNDMIGELYCIYEGEQYFANGKLDREKLEREGMLFFD